ncbi:MAG TPA: hypothetical protein VHA35_24505 [Dongiaceae bacterium]|jgi:hypothetical protein|nr:hypothetical protein [Dongiaceae bacterium]
MSDYFLVGNRDEGEDLWFVSKKDGVAVPVPKEAWLSIVSLFQADKAGAEPERETTRDSLAQSIIDNVEMDNVVTRNVCLSFSTNQLGRLVMNRRSHPIDKLFQDNDPLAGLLKDVVARVA